MQFLDSAGVRQFKQYNDSKYVVTEDVSTIDTPARDTYTKDEIDNMLDGLIESETDPIFTASAASGITSNDITSWNGKQDSISDLAAIRSGAALGATSVQTETDPTVPAWAKAATKPTYTAAEVGALPASTSIPSKTSDLTNDSGYIDTETDPVFSASVAAGITSSDITNWNSKTSNTGTITGITMNGASKGTSGVVDLGTVITAHQDISGKADKSAAIGSLSLSLNSTDYKITLSGTKVDGTTFTVSDVIDLPLESVVVNGSYDDTTKKVVLTLKNGNTVDFSIADLIAGLQSEITSTNKLSADLIADGTTNKVVTATEKSTWNGKQDAISDLATIRSNAEAGAAKVSNVQSDWNATSGLAQILNKPTIPAAVTESTVSGWGFTKNIGTYSKPSGGIPKTDLASAVQTSLGKADTALQSYTETDPVYSASAAAGITSSDITNWNNKVSNVQSDWNATTGAAVILNKPTIPAAVTESTVSGWGFTKNAGTLTGVSFNGTNATVTNGIAAITATIPAAANNATITIQKGGTTVDSFTVNASSNKSINIPNELPSYSASDSGKILSVNSSGQLVWITPASIYSGSATPDANTGNNGDIYLQS